MVSPGGSSRIARTFETGIERHGGVIRVCQEVKDILVANGRVTGVSVVDRRGAVPREARHLAPVVISNVGAAITFRQLLPAGGEIGLKTADLRGLIDRLEGGMSAVTLYLRLKAPASSIGVKGENFWVNTDIDHDAVEEHSRRVLEGRPNHIYVSFPSAKSGEERFHTAEIISFIGYQPFAQWQTEPTGDRDADYSALKKRIGDGLLRLAETAIPGLTALVVYQELSTPLTVENYTSHPGGRFYGLPATPARYKSRLLGPRTPIQGLYLSGEDAGCCGIVGAMMGGVSAASQVLGSKSYGLINAALKKGPNTAQTCMCPPEKQQAIMVSKARLTSTIWRLDFELEGPVETFTPGQFARIKVRDWEWRDYSIAALDGSRISFLISSRTGGYGSQFIMGVEPGNHTLMELPLGQYTLAPRTRKMVFVATGTGLAPFLSMFRQLQIEDGLDRCQLIFGCRSAAEDITLHFHCLPATIIRCFSRAEAPPGGLQGRVTDAIADITFDAVRPDFYICGSSAMVSDSKLILERLGTRNVFSESF